MRTIKILVPLELIPNGHTVTKPNGDKQYEVQRKIWIRGDDGPGAKGRMMEAGEGLAFLMSGSDINCWREDKQVALVFEELAEAISFLEHIEEEQSCK